jgi:hypothetical protein
MSWEVLIQLAIGIGLVSGMWRLVRTVSCISAKLDIYMERTNDHEQRLRVVEKGE